MKKSNNSNPLKYFNDAAASRKKSVNTGNDKLVKAQVGIQTSDKKKLDRYDIRYGIASSANELDSLKKKYQDKGFTQKDNKRGAEFYTKNPQDTVDYDFMFRQKDGNYKAVPKFYVKTEKNKEKIVRSEKKQGGVVKTKKK